MLNEPRTHDLPGGVAVPRQRDPLYEAIARPPERPRSAWDLLGRLSDAGDVLVWPVITTVAALLPARICRLIRGGDDEGRS